MAPDTVLFPCCGHAYHVLTRGRGGELGRVSWSRQGTGKRELREVMVIHTLVTSVEKPALFSEGSRVTCAMENPHDDEFLSAHLVVNGVGMVKRHSQPNTKLLACCPHEW